MMIGQNRQRLGSREEGRVRAERDMPVGSRRSGALPHTKYFADLDEIVIEDDFKFVFQTAESNGETRARDKCVLVFH